MNWIKVSDRLPEISYIESDDEDAPYECHPILAFCQERPGIFCVVYLEKYQEEDKWNYGDLFWVSYLPGNYSIEHIDFDTFSHWMPLPDAPTDECNCKDIGKNRMACDDTIWSCDKCKDEA